MQQKTLIVKRWRYKDYTASMIEDLIARHAQHIKDTKVERNRLNKVILKHDKNILELLKLLDEKKEVK